MIIINNVDGVSGGTVRATAVFNNKRYKNVK